MRKKAAYFLLALTVITAKLHAQTVVVTDDNTYTTGQASSVLDVKSTAKGFLAPRMTTAQRIAIASPAEGLLVYQTDGIKGFYFYTASSWTMLAAGTGSQWLSSGNNIYYSTGNVGIGITNPTLPLSVKDTMEIRRTGTMSELLFSNTAGTGDFRIAGDGGDVFWQGGGGRNLQMGSYWGIILSGDRQTGTIPAFSAGVANTNLLVLAQRDASVPLAVQANSATQTANLMEWRSAAATLNVVDKNGNFGIGTTAPASKLHVTGANPLTLNGVQVGTVSDSVLTIASGIVRKLPFSTLTSSSSWSLTGNAGTASGSNFIGTTDNTSFKFRTSGTQRFILDSLGNAGIGTAPAFTSGIYQEKLLVDAGTTSSYNAIVARGSINNYFQLNIQNQSAGTGASADIVATADNGNESTNYIDMGINSSSNNQGIMGAANDAYLYTTGNNLLIGTGTAAKSLVFMTGGTAQGTNERMRIDGNGKVGIGTTAPATALHVFGTNPLTLTGVQTGTNTPADSLLTITGGLVRKLPASTFASSFTTGNLTETGSGILTITGGTNAVAGSGTSIQVKQANTSQNGFLSSTDWNTFNNKLSTIDTGNISNFYLKVRAENNAGTGITYNSSTGTIANAGVLSVNGNTGALTMDTGYISSFAAKSRSLFSAIAPITYANGVAGITQATTSANGYLSSTDWNTFNNKASAANTWGTTGNAGTSSGANFIGTTDNKSLKFKTNGVQGMVLDSLGNVGIGVTPAFTAGTFQEKFLVDAGVTNSYNAIVGRGTINNYLQLNVQNFSNGNNASSDVVATADNGNESVNYIDMGINSSANTQAVMGGANDAYLYTTGNNFLIGAGTAAKSLVFMTGGTVQAANERMRIDGSGNVGIGTNSPAATLDVNGSYKLGTSGTVLTNMIKTNVAINDATTFTYTATRQVTLTVTGVAANATVIVNPRAALPTGIGIAWVRASAANTVIIGFTNTDATARAVGAVTLDITVIQ